MSPFVESITTIILMIGGIALASVILSRNSNTVGVIQAGASGLGNDLAVAESPVTGVQVTPSLGYPAPTSSGYGFGT
jgi:hypothetical protein